jgi:site-specific DNA recombinase
MAKKSPVPGHKNVGIWIRVSTEDQARGESPEHHEQRARAYADLQDWTVTEVYRLEAVSGKSVKDHPEAKRMLKDVRSGKIEALIFSKLARLARNTKELLEFAEIFEESGAGLISLQERIDTSTPAGRLFYTIIAAMAQWEREEISERVAVTVPQRAKQGKPLGGKAPFGYQWKDKKLIPDPNEVPIRRRLHELFVQHRRVRAVADELNASGYRTRNGSKFSDTTVRRLLEDSTAMGVYVANRTKLGTNGKKVEIKPEKEWVRHPVKPIITEELFNEGMRILQENSRPTKRPGRKPVHLFAGMTTCKECGSKMYVPSGRTYYACRKKGCRTKIPVKDLEKFYFEQLKSVLHTPEQVEAYLHEANQQASETEKLLKGHRKEQDKLKKKIDAVYDLYSEKKITSDQFRDRYEPLDERRKQIEEEIPKLEAELDLLRIEEMNADHILFESRDLRSRWPKLTREEKRALVETITESIEVGRGTLDIHLFYFPSLEKLSKSQRNPAPSAWPRPAFPSARSPRSATG